MCIANKPSIVCILDHMATESCLSVGLISGTSADGIDACVVKITCANGGTVNE